MIRAISQRIKLRYCYYYIQEYYYPGILYLSNNFLSRYLNTRHLHLPCLISPERASHLEQENSGSLLNWIPKLDRKNEIYHANESALRWNVLLRESVQKGKFRNLVCPGKVIKSLKWPVLNKMLTRWESDVLLSWRQRTFKDEEGDIKCGFMQDKRFAA